MEPQNNSNLKGKFLILTVCSFIVGGVVGVLVDPYLPASLSNSKKGYKVGFSAARTLVEKSSMGGFFRTKIDVRTISGSVTAVNGNRITIHSNSMGNPFDVPAINSRTISIDTNTKVIQLSIKDSKTIQVGQSTSTLVTASGESYIETLTDVSSVQVGDILVVTAGENVKSLTEFTSTEIKILPKVATK